jgi:hypothetical protein
MRKVKEVKEGKKVKEVSHLSLALSREGRGKSARSALVL